MTDLPITGPDALALKWGGETHERNGRLERAFYPDTAFQEPRGYLHGGVAASAVLGAGRLLLEGGGDPTRVAVSIREPIPLGDDLLVSVERRGETAADVEIVRNLPVEMETRTVETLAFGTVELNGYEAAPDLADARQLAIVPVPEPQEHELFSECYVCGQKNGQGLQLLPGWHAPDRVVESFAAQDQYVEGGGQGAVSPIVIPALLSCPTFWAVSPQLDEMEQNGALLASYEVTFHRELRASTQVRVVAWAGTSERNVEFGDHDGSRSLHAVSALIDEDGTHYATAAATWIAVDELPEREPGRPTPKELLMPEKAGRPEERSRGDWGTTAPGRREAPGPRSWRPGDSPEPGRGAEQTDLETKGEVRPPKKSEPKPQDRME